jgi:hypothetical protein
MNEAFNYDADFNNFYEDFIGKNKKSKKEPDTTPTMTPAPTGGAKNFWSQGMVVGASSPAKEEPKKGGFFSGLGGFIKSDTGQAVLSGISKGIENRQGIGGGGAGQGGGFEGANQQRPDGLSTGAIIGIAVGGLAVLGLAIYLITKK